MSMPLLICLSGSLVLAVLAAGLWWPRPLPPRPGKSLLLPTGQTVNYLDNGPSEGGVIVLVHGVPGSAYDWGPLKETLVKHGFRVVSYDRVGYGHSDRRVENEAYSLAQNASELCQFIEALGLFSSPLTLVGWSYGGGVIRAALQENPQGIGHAVFLSSIGPAMPATAPPSPGFLRLLSWLLRLPVIGRTVMRGFTLHSFHYDPSPAWLRQSQALYLLPGTLETVHREMVAMHTENLAGNLAPHTTGIPALVIHGTEDRNVPLRVARNLTANLPNARLELFPGGGHMLPLTHAAPLATLISTFVSEYGKTI